MLLDSAVYLVFLTLVVVVYWRLSQFMQNCFLLVASYFFYGWWDWRFLVLIAASTLLDYWIARSLAASMSRLLRRTLLVLSIIINVCFLGYFKYCNFFVDSFAVAADAFGLHNVPHILWKIVLPPAISFYTFQEVAYIVDVYRRRIQPAHSLLDYALFISFFPHLIAGPIQRPSHLLPQVQSVRQFNAKAVFDGCMLILLGMFRKCVLADSCAQLANASFDGRMGRSGWVTLIGVYAFAGQIYGDFSGYSDIARGSAQLLGFHFMLNFRQPYLATSLQEFWKRWHISLSTWLRDYLYIPLGGSRLSPSRTYINLLLTMLIGGLWHGASWNFVLWGGLHGGMLSIEKSVNLRPPRSKVYIMMSRIFVFHFVCLAWLFFRAPTLRSAISMFIGLARWSWNPVYGTALTYLICCTIPLIAIDLYLERSGDEYPSQSASFMWQLNTAAVAVAFVAFGAAYESAPFVYFQF
ncbi:putative poly(beta-D-mannuronate) O-acetylase [Acidisarcina polymorpha]|uniref:Putative poly(Beta-D-mannuronate) O-acetylase n=1 Tax=Acidisarcina polymorpha TaxID=2211140 RepID=A0A2Z5G7H9_9BACT|nr:MBOAT family protein [Acidisarcina polymorpha]AXC14930.1 putative poly(beta-D-mannuronate) O-acetylase [Acidisarcina polymorpha]